MPHRATKSRIAVFACWALLLAGTAAAGSLPDGLELYVQDRVRYELWRFFDPAAPGGDPHSDFVANQLRLGARYERPKLSLHAALQYVKLYGLPSDAAGMPGGALGTGALYFAHSGEHHPEAVQLKYLSAELRDPWDAGLALTLGRFSWSGGREANSGSPRIEALKASRIADRLVGEFGWSHFQRSFDGARLRWDTESGQASVAWMRPTEGGFEDGGTRRIDEIDLVAAALTAKPGLLVPGAELQAFYLFYDDERRVRARPDNTGLPAPRRQDLEIHTFGAHLVGDWAAGPGRLDLVAWGALQTGHWFELDHRAAAGALELGYQLGELRWKPWLRIGTFRSTGDGAPGDSEHETFYQVLPTARLYSYTATYNLMNSTDSFVELRLSPTQRLGLQLEVHDLRLSNRSDLWYAGAGATQARGTIQGFSGRASGGHRHLGTVAQATAKLKLTDWLSAHAFYGHFWGGNVVETSFADDDELDFFFLELTFRWSTGD